MKKLARIAALPILVLAVGAPSTATEDDLRNSLETRNIEAVRVNLAFAGAGLGFELEIAGEDPRIEALVRLIRVAEPGGGHKCPNQGAIRFRIKDGSQVGIGLLPSHTAGLYELRLYEGDRYLEAYRVDRAKLLSVLGELGVPVEDPAFRE